MAVGSSSGLLVIFESTLNNFSNFEVKEGFEAHELSINAIAWTKKGCFCTGSCDMSLKGWQKNAENSKYENYFCIDKTYISGWIRGLDSGNVSFEYDVIVGHSDDKKLFAVYTENGNSKYILIREFENNIWRLKFNKSGNILAVSFCNKDSNNEVLLFKEVKKYNWECINNNNYN